MTPERNKQIVREFGKPERMATAGEYSRERIARLFRRMVGQLERGLRMTVRGIIAEGDGVAVEVESEGDLKNGRRYRQRYHFAIELAEGRIRSVREYLDTQHAYDVWLAP
jgi:ketosteroid isomerase-like protein